MQCLTLPNLTTAATNGATIYDQESMLTSNHEDSDVPQQCARASFPVKEIRKWIYLLGLE